MTTKLVEARRRLNAAVRYAGRASLDEVHGAVALILAHLEEREGNKETGEKLPMMPCPRQGCANGKQYDEQGFWSWCVTCRSAGLVPRDEPSPEPAPVAEPSDAGESDDSLGRRLFEAAIEEECGPEWEDLPGPRKARIIGAALGLRAASERKPSPPESDEAGAREMYEHSRIYVEDKPWGELDPQEREFCVRDFRFARDIGRAEREAELDACYASFMHPLNIAALQAELAEAKARIVVLDRLAVAAAAWRNEAWRTRSQESGWDNPEELELSRVVCDALACYPALSPEHRPAPEKASGA